MSEVAALLLAWLAGGVLGGVFFGGLWWTVRQGLSAARPALWFFSSLLLRLSIVLAGFYLVARGHWQRLLVCLLGFVIARLVVTALIRPSVEREASHAP